jgi:hypothetical protein
MRLIGCAKMRRIVVLLALLVATTVDCVRSSPGPRSACGVTVRVRMAEIAFPVVERREWVWNRPPRDPAARVPNYTWSLYLYPGPGVHVEVGRDAKGPEVRGDLTAMMRAARVIVTWPSPTGDFDDFHEAKTLRPAVERGRVVLRVLDSASCHELFEVNHPTEIRCDFTADGDASATRAASKVGYIQYAAPPT